MKIACIGYFTRDSKITVSYDTVDKMFLISEEYRDIGVKMGFNYSVKSRGEVFESLKRFKKDFYRAK